MTLTDFGLLISGKLDRMMFRKTARSSEPLLTSVLHEHGKKRIRVTAYLKDGTAFRLTIEKAEAV